MCWWWHVGFYYCSCCRPFESLQVWMQLDPSIFHQGHSFSFLGFGSIVLEPSVPNLPWAMQCNAICKENTLAAVVVVAGVGVWLLLYHIHCKQRACSVVGVVVEGGGGLFIGSEHSVGSRLVAKQHVICDASHCHWWFFWLSCRKSKETSLGSDYYGTIVAKRKKVLPSSG
jgi:hypothetical protein